MLRRPPRSTRTDTLFPYTTLFRSLGDPYHDQCQTTARLLAEALDRPVEVAFQSRFGRAKWLEPATAARLDALGRAGKSVAVFAPGFAAHRLETLEELAIRGKAQFTAAGGRHLPYLPCLHHGSSEEPSVGDQCVCTCRSWWSTYH